jgi:Tol biopolymer transport system component
VRRLAFAVTLLVVWAAFGFGVNRLLNSRKSNLAVNRVAVVPTQETPAFSLPGTIYISQGGHLYRFHAGRFTDMSMPAATGSWIQPAVATAGRLLVVARAAEYSDIYLVDGGTGAVLTKLTSNVTRQSAHVELNAWSFWPHLAADGNTVVFAYDGPKTGTTFEVHLAVWSGPILGKLETRRWTDPTLYTGGDVSPLPLPGGGVVYASYALNQKSLIVARIATVAAPGATPVYLTAAADDCGEPAIAPDGSRLAVICTADSQSARLEVIPLVNGVAGTPRVMVASCLCASPAWSPDGNGLLYLAPHDATGHFQLWWIDRASSPTPAAPKLVTSHLDFDATSAPAWAA